jgi:hypothetical protein
MRHIGPLLIVFGFFAILFLIGIILQRSERKKRKTRAEHRPIATTIYPRAQFQAQSFESALKGKGQEMQAQQGQQSDRPNRLGYDA